MKLIRILFLFIAVILLTISCSRTNEQLLQAEQLIETSPDSAMAILQKYNYNSLTDKDKAFYGLVYVRVRDKKHLSLEPDSLLDFAENYYQAKHDDHERLGECYLYRGRKFKYAFQYEKAMEYYLKSQEVSTSYLTLGRINFDIGYILCSQKEFSLARKKLIQSYNYFKLGSSKPLAFNSALYIGRTYYINGEYDKALSFYNKLKNTIVDSINIGVLYQEIALNYYNLKKYDSALYHLQKVLFYPYVTNNKAIKFYLISDIYYDINKIDSSLYYANLALNFTPDLRTKKECYRILANCYSKKKDLFKVEVYMHKFQTSSDTVQKIDSQTKGSYIETMHNTQKEVAKSRSWIWYLSVLVLLIFVLAILFYIRKHRKGLLTIKTIEEKQLVQKKESVQEIVERTKEALHQSLKEKRNELTKKIKQNTPDGRREMILQLYDELVHFKNKQHFKNEMDNTLNNLYSKLETGYPKLKTKEKQWACLNMLEIPNEESMQLLDYNTEAYKKMKQRFAQKIGVDAVANIDVVLKNILYDAT